jgi:hypothetical protein
MVNSRNRFPGRRKFLKQSAALSAGAATLVVPFAGVKAADPAQESPRATPQPASATPPPDMAGRKLARSGR